MVCCVDWYLPLVWGLGSCFVDYLRLVCLCVVVAGGWFGLALVLRFGLPDLCGCVGTCGVVVIV